MRNRLLPTVIALSLFAALAARAEAQVVPAEDHVVELGLMLWKPSPTLTLSSNGLANAGVNDIDFVQEFGIKDKSFPEFRAAIGRHHKVRVSHVKFSYNEDATIQRTFTFQGRTFTVGAPATADINWTLWKLGYEWDFVSLERGFFGVIADLKYNKVEASVNSPALQSAASTDVTAPVPTIGVIGRGYIAPMVAITGEFSGLKLNRSDFEVKFVDFDVNGTVSFGKYVGAQVGYRSVAADYLVDGDSGNLKMKGPYFGGVVRF